MKISGYIGASNYIKRHWLGKTFAYYREGISYPGLLAPDFKEKSFQMTSSLGVNCRLAVSDMEENKFYMESVPPVLVLAPSVLSIEKSGLFDFSKRGLPTLSEIKLSYIDSALELLFSPRITTTDSYAEALLEVVSSCMDTFCFVESETVTEAVTKEIFRDCVKSSLLKWSRTTEKRESTASLSSIISETLRKEVLLIKSIAKDPSAAKPHIMSSFTSDTVLVNAVCDLLSAYAIRLLPKTPPAMRDSSVKYPVPFLMSSASAYMTLDITSSEDVSLAVAALSYYPKALLVIIDADDIRSRYLKYIEDTLSKQGADIYAIWTSSSDMWGASFMLSGDITTERSYTLPDRTRYWEREKTPDEIFADKKISDKHYGSPAFTEDNPHEVLECFKNRPQITNLRKVNGNTTSRFRQTDFMPEEQAMADSVETGPLSEAAIGGVYENDAYVRQFMYLPDDTVEAARNMVVKYDKRIGDISLLNRCFYYEDTEEGANILKSISASHYHTMVNNIAKRELAKLLTSFYDNACRAASERLDSHIGIKRRLQVERDLMSSYNQDLLKLDTLNFLTIKKDAMTRIESILSQAGVDAREENVFNENTENGGSSQNDFDFDDFIDEDGRGLL